MKAIVLSAGLIALAAITLVVGSNHTLTVAELQTCTFGDIGYEQCYAVQQTSDGGFVLGGWTDSFGAGQEDMIIKKIDSVGNIEWTQTFGGTADDYCEAVQQTPDGGYVVGGWTYSCGAGGYDMLLMKTDTEGNFEWKRTYGGDCGDYCYSLQQTVDGGYILAGDSELHAEGQFDVYLVKTDSQGFLEWQNTFGESGWNDCYSVIEATDGGFILAGYSDSFGEGFAKGIVNEYIEDYQDLGIANVTQSAVRTAKTQAVVDAVHELGKLLGQNMSQLHKDIRAIRIATQTFQMADYVDLVHLCEFLAHDLDNPKIASAANVAISATSECVLANGKHGSAVENANGLSIWFPASPWLYFNYRAKYMELK